MKAEGGVLLTTELFTALCSGVRGLLRPFRASSTFVAISAFRILSSFLLSSLPAYIALIPFFASRFVHHRPPLSVR